MSETTVAEKYQKHGVEVIVYPLQDGHDHYSIGFFSLPDAEGNQEQLGAGYKGLDNGHICIMRCPSCMKENYANHIATGFCAWCSISFND